MVETGEGETRGKNKNLRNSSSLYTIPSYYLLSNDLEEEDIKLWNSAYTLVCGERKVFFSLLLLLTGWLCANCNSCAAWFSYLFNEWVD